MHALLELMAERIASGLKRRSVKSCSRWAEMYRVMGRPFPGPWTFKWHPWLREMHDSLAERNVGMKSAQAGFTENALNTVFYCIDVLGIDCLYVLPAATPDAHDFSAARFNPALELSPHLGKMFSDVQNIGHKRAGTTNLYVRGSRSRAGLKSIPTGCVILDELDEMDEKNVPLALERTAGQVEKKIWALSTPTVPKYGIHKLYLDSTQEQFFFKCPGCSRTTNLTFPECMEITGEDCNDERLVDTFLKCKECGKKLEHKTKFEWLADGKWIGEHVKREIRGFHVNQLYSSTVSPADLAASFLRSQRDPTEEQEFYNSKLGLPHVVDGAGVTDKDLDNCRTDGLKMGPKFGLVTMGIDVGRWIHYEVNFWRLPESPLSTDPNAEASCQLLKAGKVQHFEDLDRLMIEYQVTSAVVDANPDTRKAYEFASRWPGRVKMCLYGLTSGRKIQMDPMNEQPVITVDRTAWLDLSLGRFRNQTIRLPFDIPLEYKTHLKSPVRIYERDRHGNPVGRYVTKGSDEDHHAHARNYAEIALPFAMGVGESEDVESPV